MVASSHQMWGPLLVYLCGSNAHKHGEHMWQPHVAAQSSLGRTSNEAGGTGAHPGQALAGCTPPLNSGPATLQPRRAPLLYSSLTMVLSYGAIMVLSWCYHGATIWCALHRSAPTSCVHAPLCHSSLAMARDLPLCPRSLCAHPQVLSQRARVCGVRHSHCGVCGPRAAHGRCRGERPSCSVAPSWPRLRCPQRPPSCALSPRPALCRRIQHPVLCCRIQTPRSSHPALDHSLHVCIVGMLYASAPCT